MRTSRPLRDWSCWPMVPSTGSALYLRSHPVKLVCAEPYWAIIRSSLRDFALQIAVATPGLERNAPRTELCDLDPALDQQPGKAGTNVETPGYGPQAGRNCCVMNPALEAAEDCYPSRNPCFPQLVTPRSFSDGNQPHFSASQASSPAI
jgi:hypothetical protein